MSTMTLHERMMAVYRHQIPDQFPVGIYTRYLPRGWDERRIRNMGMGIIEYHPVVTFLAPPWHTYAGYISEVKGVDLQIRYTWEAGEPIELRTYETPVGTIWQKTRKDPLYGSDWITKHYIEKREDYGVMQYIVENTMFRRNDEAFKLKAADLGDDGVVLGRVDRSPYQKLLIELAGPERFLTDLYTDPDSVVSLLEAMERRMDEAFEMIVDSPAEVIWQPDNITVDMTPPKAFKKYHLPFYEKHACQVQAAGKVYHVHMDGRIKPLKDLIAQSPIDGIESFTLPELGSGLSLTEARSAWPDKVITPNFPASLCLLDDVAIRNFLDKLLMEAGREDPFMLQVSEDIPTSEWKRVLPIICEAFCQG